MGFLNGIDKWLRCMKHGFETREVLARDEKVALIWGGPAMAARLSIQMLSEASVGWGLVCVGDAFGVAFFDAAPIEMLIHVDAPMYYRSAMRRLFEISGIVIKMECRTPCPSIAAFADRVPCEEEAQSDWMESALVDAEIETNYAFEVDASDAHWALTGQTGLCSLEERQRDYYKRLNTHVETIRNRLGVPITRHLCLSPTESNIERYAFRLRGLPHPAQRPESDIFRRDDDDPWTYELTRYVNRHICITKNNF